MFAYVQLIIGTLVSHNLGIHAFVGNPVSCVQVVGNGNTSLVLADDSCHSRCYKSTKFIT